jgi:hypothetical protein
MNEELREKKEKRKEIPKIYNSINNQDKEAAVHNKG